jgi:hypothetical protein
MATEAKKQNSQAPADRKQASSPNKFEGKVVRITGDKLVIANKEGKEYSHALAKDAQVTCDGTPCKAESLKTGSRIRVTLKEGSRNLATCIEALDKKSDFAACK